MIGVPDLRTRLPGYAPGAVVAVLVALAMLRIVTQHWRQGAVLLGVALIVAAILRALFPDDRIGLLAVRNRAVDILCYAGLGLLIVALAVTITVVRIVVPA